MLIETYSKFYSIETGLQCYCDTSHSRGGVNQMCVLKNSHD